MPRKVNEFMTVRTQTYLQSMPATKGDVEQIIKRLEEITQAVKITLDNVEGTGSSPFLNRQQAADFLNVSKGTLISYEEQGFLSPIRPTEGVVRHDKKDLLNFMRNEAERKDEAAQERKRMQAKWREMDQKRRKKHQ